MTSTGNDIVSLNAINIARTKQPGFYSKILSDTEKALYYEAGASEMPFENFVWLLWSIKESAYKYLQRNTPGLIFTPTKFVVKQLGMPFGRTVTNLQATEAEGVGFPGNTMFQSIITFGPYTLYSRSFMYRELIVSVVNGDENFENTYWGIKLIDKSDPDYQSMAVRVFLLSRLHKLLHLDNLAISKNTQGFPILLNGHEEVKIPVSLSHHDHFVAYSFQLEYTI